MGSYHTIKSTFKIQFYLTISISITISISEMKNT